MADPAAIQLASIQEAFCTTNTFPRMIWPPLVTAISIFGNTRADGIKGAACSRAERCTHVLSSFRMAIGWLLALTD